MDTRGALLDVLVHAADVRDADGGRALMARAHDKVPTLETLWVDAAYAGRWAADMHRRYHLDVHVVRGTYGVWLQKGQRPPPPPKQLLLTPRRWVVERSFGWTGRCRRLAKDYEATCESEEAWIWVAMLRLLLRRLAPPPD